jgi:hypothetical protein
MLNDEIKNNQLKKNNLTLVNLANPRPRSWDYDNPIEKIYFSINIGWNWKKIQLKKSTKKDLS